MKTATLVLPGLTVKCLTLESASGPLEWWRVETPDGAIVGSGFDKAEAIEQARAELDRRAGR